MHLELINLYLLGGFSFLIGTTSILIVIEFFNQLRNQVAESYMLPTIQVEQQIVHSHLRPIRLQQVAELPEPWELEQMYTGYIEDFKSDLLNSFTKSLVPHVTITKEEIPYRKHSEIHMEIQILKKENR